jgi:hypothetical protein
VDAGLAAASMKGLSRSVGGWSTLAVSDVCWAVGRAGALFGESAKVGGGRRSSVVIVFVRGFPVL